MDYENFSEDVPYEISNTEASRELLMTIAFNGIVQNLIKKYEDPQDAVIIAIELSKLYIDQIEQDRENG